MIPGIRTSPDRKAQHFLFVLLLALEFTAGSGNTLMIDLIGTLLTANQDIGSY